MDVSYLFHKRVCLMGQCQDYGVEKLKLCPTKNSTKNLIQWRCIGYVVVGKNNNGLDKKTSQVQYKDTTLLS
jgi:hypothetical protein